MEELSIEQKAKAYDEALKVANKYKDTHIMFSSIKDEMFSELKESEDERIRKELYDFCIKCSHGDTLVNQQVDFQRWATWIEKQGEQDNNEDFNILQRFSFYSYKDEPNILYLAGLYVNEECRNKGIGTKILEVANEVAKSMRCNTIRLKVKKDTDAYRLYLKKRYNILTNEGNQVWLEKQSEQKPAIEMKPAEESLGIDSDTYNKIVDECIYGEQKPAKGAKGNEREIPFPKQEPVVIIPKFRVGDEIKTSNEESLTITKIDKKGYWSEDLFICGFGGECLWDLVPADWSEEDKEMLNLIIAVFEVNHPNGYFKANELNDPNMRAIYTEEIVAWLKSLRPQKQWKPSELQIEALESATANCAYSEYEDCLRELITQLKKLREE